MKIFKPCPFTYAFCGCFHCRSIDLKKFAKVSESKDMVATILVREGVLNVVLGGVSDSLGVWS